MALPATAGSVQISGLRELITAFKVMPEEVVEEFVDELEEAASPVKLAAQQKAGPVLTWTLGKSNQNAYTAMKIGVSRREASVWVTPDLRGRGGRLSAKAKDQYVKRVQERALDPALEENTDKIVERVDKMIDRIADRHGF